MKNKKKIKITRYTAALVATWAGCLLLLAGGYLFFHLPQKEILAQAQRQYNESNQIRELADMASQDNVISKAQQRCEGLCDQIHRYSLPQKSITDLVFEIGKMAGEVGLSDFSSKNQNNRNVSTVTKSDIVTEGWLAVEFNATFEQFLRFVNRLETTEPVVFVETLMINRATNGQEKHEVKMELSFLATTGEDKYSVATASPR